MNSPKHLLAHLILGLVLTSFQALAQSIYEPYYFAFPLAGNGPYIGSSDGHGSGAMFNSPGFIALDSSGNVYVSDSGNHTIRKITPDGWVTTLAGLAGKAGSSDGTGTNANFNNPGGIAVDNSSGNIYVADTGNHTIRLVTPDGSVSTLAGVTGSPGSDDGPLSVARFSSPTGLAMDAGGTLFIADYGNGTIRKLTPDGMVTTLAGTAGRFGSADGQGTNASFGVCSAPAGVPYCQGPDGIALDSAGNLYVADLGNNTVRKVTPSGLVSTIAGAAGQGGSDDGPGSAARFNWPEGVAVDSAGNVFVADSHNGTIRKISPAGVVTTLAGAAGTTGNGGYSGRVPYAAAGAGSAARFRVPYGLAVDSVGTLYLADSWDNTIRQGRAVIYTPYTFTTLAGNAGSGGADGPGNVARFNQPWGLAADRVGNLYVSDYNNFTIRKITLAGFVTTLAGSPGISGNADGTGNTALFGGCGSQFGQIFCRGPEGVAVDTAGNVYVSDTPNGTIRKITPAGVVTTLAGLPLNDLDWPAGTVFPPNIGAADGLGRAARFADASGLAADNLGNVYVADTGNSLIRKITPEGMVTTWAGMASVNASADGTNSTARFYNPQGVTADDAGNVYVADTGNNTIRKITPAGVVTTVAGSAGKSGSTDGTNITARFHGPSALAVDRLGNLYVADGNAIRKVTAEGVVTTLAGSSTNYGSADGIGRAARFNSPSGVAVDGSGNVYVADQSNNTIRKVTPEGVVTTLAGLVPPDYWATSTDGTGSSALFSNPYGVATDSTGNVYVADADSNTIRQITPAGVVTTLAGVAGKSGNADGTNSAALFNGPGAVAVDNSGNVYVADTDNNAIRKITPDGVVTTLAGGTNITPQFYWPEGIAVDNAGIIYVADTYNQTIRKITPDGVVTTFAGSVGQSGSADGTGSAARFSGPTGIALDQSGNIYVADFNTALVRKVTPDGVVTTLAGCATCPYGAFDGTGTNALFTSPSGIGVDMAGNVFVADFDNYNIRRITPDGAVTTVAGLAGATGSDDGTGSTARFGGSFYNAWFFSTQYIGPRGLAVDQAGNLYVADSFNGTIRKGYPENVPAAIASNPGLGIQGGPFGLTVTGLAGQLVIIEASQDLVKWAPFWTNSFSGVSGDLSSITFSDPQSGLFPYRFYRARTP